MSTQRRGAGRAAVAAAGAIAGARLAHVGLAVQDLPRMLGFYAEVLGLSVSDRGVSRRRGQEMAFLTGDTTVHHALSLVTGGGGSARGRLDHIAFMVGSLAALRAVRDRARALGAAGLRAVDHGNAWSVYFDDPEGNPVEVFATAPYQVVQPFGAALDLDRTDAEILADARRAHGPKAAGDRHPRAGGPAHRSSRRSAGGPA